MWYAVVKAFVLRHIRNIVTVASISGLGFVLASRVVAGGPPSSPVGSDCGCAPSPSQLNVGCGCDQAQVVDSCARAAQSLSLGSCGLAAYASNAINVPGMYTISYTGSTGSSVNIAFNQVNPENVNFTLTENTPGSITISLNTGNPVSTSDVTINHTSEQISTEQSTSEVNESRNVSSSEVISSQNTQRVFGNSGNRAHGNDQPHGNNGVGNGEDPQPPGNPPINDGPGTGPGNPGNRGGPDSN